MVRMHFKLTAGYSYEVTISKDGLGTQSELQNQIGS